MSNNIPEKEIEELSSSSKVNVTIEVLKEITKKLLVANQLPIEQADIVADCFVEADACGVITHGVSVLPAHINKIKSGSYNLNPNFNVIRDSGAFAVINSDNAIGPVSAVYCMNYAIEKCKETGIFTVLSRNSNTYGPGFYYPLLAAKNGFIGIALSNSPAAMPPLGGIDKLFGTNPFSFAVPCKEMDPIIFDMATSKVAKSKINEARINNKDIPLGWALDENGNPTTNPIEAIKGLVLPMANHKGYGLALTIDILTGVLSGAAFLNNVGRFYSENNEGMNVGQTFIAINPHMIYGEGFYETMDKYVETIRSSRSNDSNNISLPGDNKLKNKKESIQKGIKLAESTVKEINSCLEDCGLDSLIL
jgi:(2R)-3-sulfolactate dehydrogenase (NADP+)